ncbi:MAG: 6-oxocyclohex-1-ene-1-carbonyl-CoA hydratase, partial [candidate division Zixibacteria bacterium]
VDGKFVRNPMLVTDAWLSDGEIVYGSAKRGDDRKAAKEILASGEIDLTPLDQLVESFCTKMLYLMPDCINKTLNSLRKKKLEHWDRNQQTNRDWLGLNMMTEGKAGFRAFNEGPRGNREVDFVKLRQMLAEGHPWDDNMLDAILPKG